MSRGFMVSWILRKIRNKKKNTDINFYVKLEVKIESLQYLALNTDRSLVSDESRLDSPLIVSLTTFSKKINEVHLVIESLGQQSVRPDKIILWLDENEFSIDNIPSVLIYQMKRGLDIRFCPNYKSYKKIIPTLDLYPDAHIITVDDDVLYASNMIDVLVKEQKQFPRMIIGHRGHRITFNANNKPKPYKQWDNNIYEEDSSHNIMLTGCGGIIYPPKSLHPDATNVRLFQELSPHADDLWLKIMAIKNDTLCKKTKYSDGGLALKRNRDIGLAQINVKNGGNDVQFRKIIDFYGVRFNNI